MQRIIQRDLSDTIKIWLHNNPIVAILEPRQYGKTTVAGQIIKKINPICLSGS